MPQATQVPQVASKPANGASTALEAANAIPATGSQPAAEVVATATATPATPALPTYEQLAAMLAEVQKQLAVASQPKPAIDFKIGDKGGVSVIGLGRFPLTQYQEQWDKFIGVAEDANDFGVIPQLKAFIAANRSKLSVKPAKGQAKK